MDEEPSVGIHLGATYSCIGIRQNDRVEIIANNHGNRTTPSYVAFAETQRLIGEEAKTQLTINPENTVFSTKRLLGKLFDDPLVQADMKLWPFRVVKGPDQKPQIVVYYKGEQKAFSPEEISAMVLIAMKETAESYLGRTIKNAVITVPAYFTESQRCATKDAGIISGLNVIRIIREPIAAAIAYGLDKHTTEEQYLLIFDLGGSTLDVTLVGIEDGIFEVRGIAGNTHLGGEDFNNRMVEYFIRKFKNKSGIDVSADRKAIRRLNAACEKAKRELSFSSQVSIEIEDLAEGVDLFASMTIVEFEELNIDYFKSCIKAIKRVLRDSHVAKNLINEVVLVGGSSKIPKMQSLIKKFFDGKELCKDINPDEVIAYGATIQAGIIYNQKLPEIFFIDLTLLTLGIETAGGLMSPLILRNTQIPCKKSKTFTTFTSNQSEACIKVIEGERGISNYCSLLGIFNLEGITPAPRGVSQIEVTFSIDTDGNLSVYAEDKHSGISSGLILNNKDRLSCAYIESMVAAAETHKQQDLIIRSRIQAKNNLKAHKYNTQNNPKEYHINNAISIDDKATIDPESKEIIEWIENKSYNTETEQSHRDQSEIKSIEDQIINKILRKGRNFCKNLGHVPFI